MIALLRHGFPAAGDLKVLVAVRPADAGRLQVWTDLPKGLVILLGLPGRDDDDAMLCPADRAQ